MIELLLVVALIAVASAGVVFTLRDYSQNQLEREAQRLIAMLESARAQSRASGLPVYWHANFAGFVFAGLPAPKAAPSTAPDAEEGTATTPWLSEGVSVADGAAVNLGPEPIIGRQQIVLQQGGHSMRIATDGLRPFAVQAAGTVDGPAP